MPDQLPGDAAAAFTIRADGNELPAEMRGDVTEVVVEASVDAASMFAVVFANWDGSKSTVKWSDGTTLVPGTAVEIQLGYAQQSLTTVLRGEVAGLELAFPKQAQSLLTVRGFDRLHRFRIARKTRVFQNVKDSDVAQQLASDAGLTADVDDSGIVYEHVFQHNQSDFDFLAARASRVGFELLVDDKTLHFRKVGYDKAKVAGYSIGKELLTFFAELTTATQPSEVVVRGWDRGQKQALVGHATDGDVSGSMGGSQNGAAAANAAFGSRVAAVVDRPVATQDEADRLAQSMIVRHALQYVTAEATLVGDPAVAAGTVIELTGLGSRFSGLYYATRVRHELRGAYRTHVRLQRTAA